MRGSQNTDSLQVSKTDINQSAMLNSGVLLSKVSPEAQFKMVELRSLER